MNGVLIDVREPGEYLQSHVDGSINIPLSKMANNHEALADIPKDSTVILYCNSGNRSGVAEKILKRYGYMHVIDGINREIVASRYLE